MPDKEMLALSEYRLEKADELIADASLLFNDGSYKSSNNRSYYAIFHAIRALLALDGIDFKKHSGIIQYFQKEYVKSGLIEREYSDIFMSASRIRNVSDYDDFYIATKEEAEEQLKNAKKFYDRIKAFLDTKRRFPNK